MTDETAPRAYIDYDPNYTPAVRFQNEDFPLGGPMRFVYFKLRAEIDGEIRYFEIPLSHAINVKAQITHALKISDQMHKERAAEDEERNRMREEQRRFERELSKAFYY